MTNDSQITMRAQEFTSQEELVMRLSKNMPKEYILYVKPHPGCYLYSFWKLRECVKKGNVRIIRPEINAHDLIRDSVAVIVINSSVGFESLFYFKPVITLGRPFYGGNGVTLDVSNMSYLKNVLKYASNFKPDEKKIKAFIYSVYKSTWPGVFYVDRADNYKKLAESFIAKLARMEKCYE